MRLTLRTLMAYLDDVLQPEMLKEMGDKIRQSSVASGLIGRIREVMRRRRLGTPDLDGPGMGIDPNTVAEYLNDVLDPEGVEAVEQVCLSSDIHLAEVAACHQIVAHHFSNPMDVVPSIREHMYALGSDAEAIATGDAKTGVAIPGQTAPVKPKSSIAIPTLASLTKPKSSTNIPVHKPDSTGIITPESKTFHDSLPAGLGPTPWTSRLLPASIVLLLVAVWLGLLMFDPGLLGGRNQAANTNASTLKPGPGLNGNSSEKPNPKPDVQPDATDPGKRAELVAEAGKEATMKPNPARPADPLPPPDVPEIGTTPKPPTPEVKPTVPTETVVAVTPNVTKPVEMKPAPPSDPVPTTKPAVPEVVPNALPQPAAFGFGWNVQYSSADGMLLTRETRDGTPQWFMQPRKSEIKVGQTLACPEPYETTLQVGPKVARITVLSSTVFELQGKTETAPLSLHIQRGRLLIQGDLVESAFPLKIETRVGMETFHVELMTSDSQAAIEIRAAEPLMFEQKPETVVIEGAVYGVSGAVRVKEPQNEEPRLLAKGQWMGIRAAAFPPGTAAQSPPTNPTADHASTWPAWIDPQNRKVTPVLRKNQSTFEKAFELTRAIEPDAVSMIRDPQPKIGELAVQTLALVGNRRYLVEALAQGDHEEVRAAAAGGLRNWLVASPRTGEELGEFKAELASFFREEDVPSVYQLLWGYGPNDGKSRVVSLQLLDNLRSTNVSVRELAYRQVLKFTGKKYDFRPLGTPQQRELGLKKWVEHIDKEGALVRPE